MLLLSAHVCDQTQTFSWILFFLNAGRYGSGPDTNTNTKDLTCERMTSNSSALVFQSAPLRGQLHAIVIINLLPVTLGRDDASAQTHSTNRGLVVNMHQLPQL